MTGELLPIVYDRALTEAEIAELHANPSAMIRPKVAPQP